MVSNTNKISYSLIIILLMVMSGCQENNKSLESSHNYHTYVNDSQPSLYQKKESRLFTFEINYLSSQYLALLETERSGNTSKMTRDSLHNKYKDNLYFQFIVRPKKSGDNLKSLVHRTAINQQDVERQVRILNFRMKQYFFIKIGDVKQEAILAILESDIQDTKKMTFNVVFPKKPMQNISNIDFLMQGAFFHNLQEKFNFSVNALEEAENNI